MNLIIKRMPSSDRHISEYSLQEHVPYGVYISMQGPARGGLLTRFSIDHRQTGRDSSCILSLLKAAVAAYEAELAAKATKPNATGGE